jgi:hypothetical protein
MENYGEAAVRHFGDAETLAVEQRWGGAGHLIGFAAACALKHKIVTLRPGQNAPHGHFPEIAAAARKHLQSHRAAALLVVLKISTLMAGWNVALRYAEDCAVGRAEYERWRIHAMRILGAAGLSIAK